MSNEFIASVVRVDLTTGSVATETLSETEYRRYMGGRALIGKYLLTETEPGTDPFSPQNPLIFAPGILTGAPIAGSGRNAVGAISPLTGGFGCSEAGGFWPAALRRAGVGALIVTGQSQKPVTIVIDGDSITIQDASELWGNTIEITDEKLRQQLGSDFRIATIGPAGENCVRYASVHNDITHVAGRTGMGAVMGSKRLKAVAVRGSESVPVADPQLLKSITGPFMKDWKKRSGGLYDTGTSGIVTMLSNSGGLPTRAFQYGAFEGAEKIGGQRLRDEYLVDRDNCYGCPINCKRVVEVKGKFACKPELGGPEYETLAALGSLCEVDDLEAVCCANALCNAYGLDTISTGVVIAFVMECNELGIDLGDDAPDVKFGDAEGMVELCKAIGNRQGFGELLGEGVARVAAKIGGQAEDIALHVRGQELPMHEPRLKAGLGLGYAVSPTGADHCHNIHDTQFAGKTPMLAGLAPFGVLEPVPADSLAAEKVRMFRYVAGWKHFLDCAVLCHFVPWSVNEVVDMVRAVTGWNTSLLELFNVAERAVNLGRLVNMRQGLGAKEDKLPRRMYEEIKKCSIEGAALSEDDLKKSVECLYKMSLWDEQGRPLPERLAELDLGWAIRYLDEE